MPPSPAATDSALWGIPAAGPALRTVRPGKKATRPASSGSEWAGSPTRKRFTPLQQAAERRAHVARDVEERLRHDAEEDRRARCEQGHDQHLGLGARVGE